MMIITTAFIRGEAAAASKKKGHLSWKSQDHSKRQANERKSDFRSPPREGRGSSRFTPLIKTPKENLVTKAGKFKPPPPMRTTKQKLTQSFAYDSEIPFLPLADSDGTEGPLIIEAEIGRHMILHIYIDGGSSTEILYEHCFNQLCPEIKSQMVPVRTSLTGFSGETIWPLGQLRIWVTIRDVDHCTKAWMNFMIIRSILPYNGIIGRPGIREIQAVPSTTYGMLKFPADGRIMIICSTILIPAEWAIVITSPKEIPKEAGTSHQNIKVAIHLNFPDQEVAIGGTLSLAGQGYSPVRQKKRAQAPEHAKAIQVEVQKLIAARIMREVYYHNWLSNSVMVKKVGRNMEVYVDDLVIKSHTEAEMLRDIGKKFRTLRKINMKLNPKICTFRAVEGMFLGYTITPEGIKSCLDKMEVVLQLPSPRTIKERCIKKCHFRWTPEAEQAFKQLKQHLSELPMLVAPKPKEELIVYLSASYGAVSGVLMTERGTVQTPV
ncbi:reverse transcriptase domain-containing protein [Tanacetum coccineum]